MQRPGTHAETDCPVVLLVFFKRLKFWLGTVLAVIVTAGMSPAHVRPDLPKILPSSANDFARDVLREEVEAQEQDHALWSYSKQVRVEGKPKLFRVYQTSQGEIERLVAVDGHSLTPTQAQKEDQRIQKLIIHPAEMRQQEKKRHSDGDQARELLRMFPEAFEYQYDGTQGSLVRMRSCPIPGSIRQTTLPKCFII